jgi:hypothetical protein
MLEKTLSKFSLNSLKVLADTDYLKFFKKTLNSDPEYNVSYSQNTLLKQVIINSNPITIFLDKNSRYLFIDRLHKNNTSIVIEKTKGKAAVAVHTEHYIALKEFCNNERNPPNFLY